MKKRKKSSRIKHPRPSPILPETPPSEDGSSENELHHETSPRLTGGDVDADWQSAHSVGDEAVGGSVATPDQDIVDELGEALGMPQKSDAIVRTSSEILGQRDADRWRIEREAAEEEERG